MYTSYDTCFVCEAPIECCFQLPGLPMADTFSEKTAKKMLYGIDNEFLICKSCCHLQLKNIIDAKILYSSAYSFRTGLSNSAISSAHICFQFIQDNVDQKWNNVLEIGCSDLYFLQLFANKPTFLLGVDPIYKNSENEVPHSNNINVLGGTLEDVANNELLDKMFDLIICRHVVEHINNLELFFRTLLSHSNDKTYFVFEFPMSEPMINGFRFDHIFHQHVNYFSLFSFETLLRRFGLYIVAYSLSDTGWGNGIFIIKRGKARQGKARQGKVSQKLIIKKFNQYKHFMAITGEIISNIQGNIYGYGASQLLPILAYHLDNDFSQFKYIFDDDANKYNLTYSNLSVDILKTDFNIIDSESTIVITAVDSVKSLLPTLTKSFSGKIIYPLPIM